MDKRKYVGNYAMMIATDIKRHGFSCYWEAIDKEQAEHIKCELAALELPECQESYGVWKSKLHDFCDDNEKMVDFFLQTKDEFLTSYSYMTEYEYDMTVMKIRGAMMEKFRKVGHEAGVASDGKMLKKILDEVREFTAIHSK